MLVLYRFFHENHHVFEVFIFLNLSWDQRFFYCKKNSKAWQWRFFLLLSCLWKPDPEVSSKIKYPPNIGNYSCLYHVGLNEGTLSISTHNSQLLITCCWSTFHPSKPKTCLIWVYEFPLQQKIAFDNLSHNIIQLRGYVSFYI